MAGPQGRNQVRRHDAAAAGDIDEVRAALHLCEEPGIEHPQRLWCLRRRHDHEVGLAQALLQPVGRAQLDHARRRVRHPRVAPQHPHAEGGAELARLAAGAADTDDQHRLGRQVDHPRASLPLLLRQVVLEATRKGEHERHGVGREVLVVTAPHVRHHDIAFDERVIEPVTAQASAGGADPAQPLRASEELWRHRPVGRVGVLNVGEGVFGIPECLDDRAGDGLSDLLRP